MCSVCGCGEGEVRIEGDTAHGRGDGHGGAAPHAHTHHHPSIRHDGLHHWGEGPAGAHAPGLEQTRMVRIEQDILAENAAHASANRRYLEHRGLLALNVVSSPGSGKTTLLARTITDLSRTSDGDGLRFAVIEGDQQTTHDAERIRATGAAAIQINTGKGCHLDAHMVGHALESLAPADGDVVLIENVGNLVCPAAFDLGEAHKVVVLSVTEGDDKPLKYPDMFHVSDLMLLAKTDLLPYVDFDVERCLANARRVNPRIKMLAVSAKTGEGLPGWYAWLRATRAQVLAGREPTPAPAERS
ncbi:MAG: hydrogenase nickel incorporation protein HypB [Ectothiorhodospiraceae bacterium]|nr:hydrogenase nickel incorporation protein HypB [Ectothiorhodospiraceae bacterium]